MNYFICVHLRNLRIIMTSQALSCALLFYLLAGSAVIRADVVEDSFAFDLEEIAALNPAPGTVITKENVASFSDILAPKLVDLISDEFLAITTGEALSIPTHPAYLEATKRYLDQTELGRCPGYYPQLRGGTAVPQGTAAR